MPRPGRCRACALGQVFLVVQQARPRGTGAALGEWAANHPRAWRHLQRLWRPAGDGSSLGTGHGAAAHRPGRMAAAGGGTRPARASAQSHPDGSVRPAAIAARRPHSTRAGLRQSRFPPFVSRASHPEEHLPAPAGHGRGAFPGRAVVGVGRPVPGSLRRGLRAGESHRALTDSAGGVSRLPRAAAGGVLSTGP